MKNNMKASIISKHLSVEQQELLFIYNKKSEPTTIEELQGELKLPRTTIVDHLKLLEKDNFILKEKKGKILNYYPVPEIAEKILSALSQLKSAYIYTLRQMRENELKSLKEEQKNLEEQKR